ncbi:WGR domain-containing protein [Actinokineospora diospyrosa]|uniref:WGR domain-containing protein, predicted DNA-binding domain in MolR n=1 Tax=Actinokineospora diospyrosa TaxID=103728 RepID=A0ABT1I5U9_9PSEU|nr:WGR domain-containing protein [Actinokineospora diospyrosa]MCP2267999.1 WGR domain-containing protein, predicted DNA-binding domain in MolR [Actinokineospora diospyrosa]
MSATTYLELSETGGGAHKFYEVRVEDTEVTITYGRIGEQGQVRTASFADHAKALKAAEKKVGEKVRKGYAAAVKGERQRRPVSRREIVSTRSTARQAPVLWRFASGAPAFGIFIGEDRAWVGNENGDVYTLTHDGRVTGRFGLPDSVKCIVADDFWVYAGCDDGNVYDLGAKVPRVAYEIAGDVDIYWLDIHDGVLGVSDRHGGVTVVDHEDEFQWSRPSTGDSAWMVRNAAEGVFHGDSSGVTHYSTRGDRVWHTDTSGSVLFGWQERTEVFAGTSRGWVHRFAKSDGREKAAYRCDAAVFSCATSPDGEFVFAGDNQSSVYCFAADGTRLWKLGTGCGSAYSMQYRDERLYLVTTDGSLACVDASPAAVHAAEQGQLPTRQDIKAGSLDRVEATAEVEVITHSTPADGVVVECVQHNGRVRVHVVSEGYDSSWLVQFPKNIRVPGARYVVSEVLTSASGAFYRARGEIKRIR